MRLRLPARFKSSVDRRKVADAGVASLLGALPTLVAFTLVSGKVLESETRMRNNFVEEDKSFGALIGDARPEAALKPSLTHATLGAKLTTLWVPLVLTRCAQARRQVCIWR